MTDNIDVERLRSRLCLIGIGGSILMLWNGVCDYIYGYSPSLSGLDYFSPAVFHTILTANGRPHWMLLVAQTAGWLYPLYALTYYTWWIGMRRAGFWLGRLPIILLAYAVLMIGGMQHAGWAFLTVLEQAKAVVGSHDPTFFALANRYILEHFIVGDLTAALALNVGAVLLAVGVLSGKTKFPRWFVIASPLGALVITMIVGVLLPAPYAGFVLAPFGTWFMLVPNIAGAVWLRKDPGGTNEMIKATKFAVPTLLVLSGIMLAILVPGGPIETRHFAHIDPVILGAFNTFLTFLGIASLLVAYFAYKARRMAFMVSALCGLGYFLVYVLDLFQIFPVSPDPMPPALWGIEVAGTILSLPLMALAARATFGAMDENNDGSGRASMKVAAWLGVPIVLVALAIIAFATHAAMQGG